MIEFCKRSCGRISVMVKGVNECGIENVFRVGTIHYDHTLKQYVFFQGFFGMGTKISFEEIDGIAKELSRMNKTL